MCDAKLTDLSARQLNVIAAAFVVMVAAAAVFVAIRLVI